MSLLTWSILAVVVGSGVYWSGWGRQEERPAIDTDGWWGRGEKRADDTLIKTFKVSVSDSVLTDLKQRLTNARLGEDLENNQNFHYGFNVATMKQVITHWKDKYDWRKHEKELNKFPQYKTQIEGIDVHFLRIKPNIKGKKQAKVLLMTHGWPGSVWEFYKIIPLLTDPVKHGGRESDALEVICPSIPGYGFSEAPHQLGFDENDAARVFVKLMERLGHKQFYVQGGDWGASITQHISVLYPSQVLGAHFNMYPTALTLGRFLREFAAAMMPSLFYKENEYEKFVPPSKNFLYIIRETGYMHLQATKPDTIGMALNDSPVGLAAYILEKFSTWTRDSHRELPDGGLTNLYTLDELLTNVMIYWVTGTIGSAQRLYREHFTSERVQAWEKMPVEVPTGLAYFPDELVSTPEYEARYRYKNIVQLTDMPYGGHFAAFEQPKMLANDIRSFIRKVEQVEQKDENV